MRERVVKTRVCILTALVGVLQAAVVVYTSTFFKPFF
jgi:hypothetical protein